MPKRVIPLTPASADQAMPREKPYKLFDGDGLYIEVQPSGSKFWRMKYRQKSGKENVLSFGRYPDVSIEKAREHAHQAHQMLRKKLDPRTEFNREKLYPPPKPIPLDELIDEAQWGHVQASILRVTRDAIRHLHAALFPAIARLPADAARRSMQRAAMRQVETVGLQSIYGQLENIAAALAGGYLLSGVSAQELAIAMTDARNHKRRSGDKAASKPQHV